MQSQRAWSLITDVQLKNIYNTLLSCSLQVDEEQDSCKRSQNKPEYKEPSWKEENSMFQVLPLGTRVFYVVGKPFRKLSWSCLRLQDLKKGSSLMRGWGSGVESHICTVKARVRKEYQFLLLQRVKAHVGREGKRVR